MVNKLVEEKHGTFEGLFSSEVIRALETTKKSINPILEQLWNTTYTLRYFEQDLAYVQRSLKNIVEQAVYNSMELGTIIKAQVLVSIRIKKIQGELKYVMTNIQVDNEGHALESYHTTLDEAEKLFGYFDTMIHDSFGEKVTSS